MVGVDFLDVLRSTGKNLGQTTESAIWSKTYVRWDIFAKSNVYIFCSVDTVAFFDCRKLWK